MNLNLQHPGEQILVVTSMNLTADLVSEALYKIPIIKNQVLRIYSQSYEDIFNVEIRKLPEFSLLYKMLFDAATVEENSKSATTQNQGRVIEESKDQGRLDSAVKYIE